MAPEPTNSTAHPVFSFACNLWSLLLNLEIHQLNFSCNNRQRWNVQYKSNGNPPTCYY
uniref:Uncharacterized protein n=1 Tax=Anguilla anguilla TaxID=7936 RepID=A0A0E9RL30_ANGAN